MYMLDVFPTVAVLSVLAALWWPMIVSALVLLVPTLGGVLPSPSRAEPLWKRVGRTALLMLFTYGLLLGGSIWQSMHTVGITSYRASNASAAPMSTLFLPSPSMTILDLAVVDDVVRSAAASAAAAAEAAAAAAAAAAAVATFATAPATDASTSSASTVDAAAAAAAVSSSSIAAAAAAAAAETASAAADKAAAAVLSARAPAGKSDEPGHASGCEVPVELDYVQVLALVDCAYNNTRTAHPEFDDARDTSDLNRTLREIVGAFRPDSTSAPQMLRVLRQHIAAGFFDESIFSMPG